MSAPGNDGKEGAGGMTDRTPDPAGEGTHRASERASTRVRKWLAPRMDGVPSELLSWLEVEENRPDEDRPDEEGDPAYPDGGDVHDVGRSLERRGVESLRRAMAGPGRNRDSAFHLLAADAYLTWSAEALLESSDPESALRALLRRVAAAGG